jgi:hypothetical protein
MSGVLGLTAKLRMNHMFALRIGGVALVPLARPTVYLEDVGNVHRPAPFGARVLAGVDLELP